MRRVVASGAPIPTTCRRSTHPRTKSSDDEFPKWSDVVAAAGEEEAVAKARERNQSSIDGHRLTERCKALGGQSQISGVFGNDQ
ncbi:hypothetical protein [Actinomadura monticuli]|uniref:Uncharacterized protein n=1 Tax=Actinomadura monticuli TaxID=3097367 RepID=A0ABV4Q952_9ACTN